MKFRQRNHIDFQLMICVIVLMLLSLGVVYSASASYAEDKYGESEWMLTNHAIKVLLGIIALFIGMLIDYHKFLHLTKMSLIIAVFLLIATLYFGHGPKSVTRWLNFFGVSVQPSEFAKYALLFHLSTLIAMKGEMFRDFKTGFLPIVVWIGIVTGLIFAQPDFSMGVIIIILSIIMMLIGQVKWSHLFLLFLVGVPIVVIYFISAKYRIYRILSFLGLQDQVLQNDLVKKAAYQLNQGLIAFGNGGIFGVGPGDSRQRDFFLPESYSDFIFSIIGEEYGFIGTTFFILLFIVIMLRGFKVAKHAADQYGRVLAIAITSAIIVPALVNAAVTLGILPTTGLPMPFVSYGGSSMVFSAFAVGVLLSISSFTDLHPRVKKIHIMETENLLEQNIGKVY